MAHNPAEEELLCPNSQLEHVRKLVQTGNLKDFFKIIFQFKALERSKLTWETESTLASSMKEVMNSKELKVEEMAICSINPLLDVIRSLYK